MATERVRSAGRALTAAAAVEPLLRQVSPTSVDPVSRVERTPGRAEQELNALDLVGNKIKGGVGLKMRHYYHK